MAGNRNSGAKKKPTALKIVQGTNRKDRTNPDEPKLEPMAEIPKAPATLSRRQKEYYEHFSKNIFSMGILSDVDVDGIVTLAVAWDEYIEAKKFIDKNGAAYETENRFGVVWKRYPQWTIQQQAFTMVIRMLGEYGLTPGSRTKVSVVAKGDKDKREGAGGWQDL